MEAGDEQPDIEWPSEQSWEFAERLAWPFVGLLLRENRWIHRRVESIGMLSKVDARRNVSVDFTIPAEFHQDLKSPAAEQWAVPLGVVKRGKLRNFDLVKDGRSIPLMGFHDALQLAVWILAQTAIWRIEIDPDVADGEIDDVFIDLIHEICGEDELAASRAIIILEELADAKPADFQPENSADFALWEKRCLQASLLRDFPMFMFLARMFSSARLLVALVSEIEGRQIVKYGYDAELDAEPEPVGIQIDADFIDDDMDVDDQLDGDGWLSESDDLGRYSWLKRARDRALSVVHVMTGVAAQSVAVLVEMVDRALAVTQYFDIPVPALTRAESYHVEVKLPEELVSVRAAIYDGNDFSTYDSEENAKRISLQAFEARTGDRPRLFFLVRPYRSGFPSAAVAIAATTSTILVAGAVLSPLPPTRASTSVSVILGMSALFTGLVVRAGEHRLVQHSLRRPRWLLLGVAVAAVSAAVSLGFVDCPEVQEAVWKVSGLWAIIMTVPLCLYWRLAQPIKLGEG